MKRSKLKTSLREFILEQLKEFEEFSTNIEKNKFELLKNGEVVGSTMFSHVIMNDNRYNNEPYILLWNLKLNEVYRGYGYSKILMKKVLEYLSEMVNIVELQVHQNNYIAVNLYKSFGFEVYAKRYHILTMSKRI